MPSGKQGPAGPQARAITEQIQLAMLRHRISGARLALQTGLSQTYISKRLRHEVTFTLNDLAIICDALGEDVFDIIDAARK